MSEKELNSYRFLSGEDPSDEMLESLLKGMGKEAVDRRKRAAEKVKNEIKRQREILDAEWQHRIKSLRNA
ncbi:MAG: hypothetical protein K2I92_06015 [Muribaculaceae bacterium]|nr:hypothetical protein [Muribaculaceae bacterium]